MPEDGQNPELENTIEEAIDLINDTAQAAGAKRGEVALELLGKDDISTVTRKAALRVRAEVLLEQNHQGR